MQGARDLLAQNDTPVFAAIESAELAIAHRVGVKSSLGFDGENSEFGRLRMADGEGPDGARSVR